MRNTSSDQDKSNLSPVEVVSDGPKTKIDRPKRKKWKLQARSVSSEGHKKKGPSMGKRAGYGGTRSSPNHKKIGILSPHKHSAARGSPCNHLLPTISSLGCVTNGGRY